MSTAEEQLQRLRTERDRLLRRMGQFVLAIQVGEYWLDRHGWLGEARAQTITPDPPPPQLKQLAGPALRLEYARETNAYLHALLRYQRAICDAQLRTATEHGQEREYTAWRSERLRAGLDWLEYDPDKVEAA